MYKHEQTHGRWHMSKSEVRKIYNDFIENYDNRLEYVRKLLKVDKLTFNVEEIKQFGDLYYGNYKSPEKLNLTYDELLNLFLTYSGEMFLFYFGGVYVFTFSKGDITYGFPAIIDFGPKGVGWAGFYPHSCTYAYENMDDESFAGKEKFCLTQVVLNKIENLNKRGYFEVKRTIRELTDDEIRKDYSSKDAIIFKRDV